MKFVSSYFVLMLIFYGFFKIINFRFELAKMYKNIQSFDGS